MILLFSQFLFLVNSFHTCWQHGLTEHATHTTLDWSDISAQITVAKNKCLISVPP